MSPANKFIRASVVLLLATLCGQAGDQPPRPTNAKAREIVISGEVVGPDGKPVAGARVFHRESDQPMQKATSDKNGRFEFRCQPVSLPDGVVRQHTLVACADGFGAGLRTIGTNSSWDVTLKLVKDDVPIEGRVIDLEGRPVAGVSVRVQSIRVLPRNSCARGARVWV